VLDVAREMLGEDKVVEMPAPSMGSEDYAWFAERAKSAHLRIGSKIEGLDTAIHRTDYQLNEAAIPLATRLMSRAVLEFTD
jgi:metal-dependent amidase/aminoacylase/carboxypeptidase family protein